MLRLAKIDIEDELVLSLMTRGVYIVDHERIKRGWATVLLIPDKTPSRNGVPSTLYFIHEIHNELFFNDAQGVNLIWGTDMPCPYDINSAYFKGSDVLFHV